LHKPGLSAEALASWDAEYGAGAKADEAGRFGEALEHFEAAARIDDHFAELHYRLGRCQLALGRAEPARRQFVAARDRDALPFRADGRLNDIIRTVAAARVPEGVTLVDFEKRLEQQAVKECAPGERYFLDHVHFRFAGDYEVARALLPGVVAALGDRLGRPRGAPLPTVEACAAALGYNAWEEWQIDSAVLQQTSKAPFLDQVDHRLRQLRTERQLKDRAGSFTDADLQRARGICLAAIEQHPDDWQLRNNFGSMSLLTGDLPAAVTQLQPVVAAFPEWIPARMMLGNALLKARRFSEAAEQFKACLRVERRFEPARRALAEIQGSPR
jgi:tetratricopeptide (TPR) repeat protein